MKSLYLTKNILTFSDVHFRHKKTPTKFIIENLTNYVHDYIYKEPVDCVFIAGDLFDSLMNLNNIELSPIIAWISSFLTLCAERGTAVRALEGTPAHDWKQSRLFNDIIQIKPSLKSKLDYAYHDDMAIEYVQKLCMNVLYIPDEYGLTAEYTFQQVLKKMEEHHLSKVDLVIMHGLFDFQEIGPQNVPMNKATHRSIQYLNICNHYVFVGHSHVHTCYKRILVEGSFDRLAHGEESPKGFIAARLESDPKNDEFYFIENKGAKIYKTIEIRTEDMERCRKQLERHMSKHPAGSHFRLLIKNTNPLYSVVDVITKNYPDYYFTKKSIETKKVPSKITIEKVSHDGITINQQTLKGIVVNKITTMNMDLDIQNRAIIALDEFV